MKIHPGPFQTKVWLKQKKYIPKFQGNIPFKFHLYTQGLRRKSSVHDVTKVATNINTIFANLMQVKQSTQYNISPHTITMCQRHGQSTRFLLNYKLQIFLGPMLILFCPKMSAVRTRLNRTGCVKNKHCRCEIKGRSMEVSSWNSFSDLRLLTSIILTVVDWLKQLLLSSG